MNLEPKPVESVSGAEGPAVRAGQPSPEPEESSRRMQTGTEFEQMVERDNALHISGMGIPY